MKDFRGELHRFEGMLRRREPFAIARFGDGEIQLILDLVVTKYGDFSYDPQAAEQRWYRDRLIDSLRHQQRNYFVAISAPCCLGDADFFAYKMLAGQPEEALTFACLFVNDNYPIFLERWLPLFAEREVNVVCHRQAAPEALPFNVRRVWRVGDNAWIRDYALIDEIRASIRDERIADSLFLIAAGPFAGIVAQQLFAFAPGNTYIDVGSTLDPMLFGRDTRPYHRGKTDHNFCTWEPARLPAPAM